MHYNGSGAIVRSRRKAVAEWLALKPGAHEGYVSWDHAEAIRKMVSENVPAADVYEAPKHGAALLAGLLRCRRCGQKLNVQYIGAKHNIPRYVCTHGRLDYGEASCIGFGGLRVDDAVETALLAVVRPAAVEAALAAEAQDTARRDEAREALSRDSQANWRRAGTARWCAWQRSKGTSPATTPLCHGTLLCRSRLPRLPRTSRLSGQRQRLTPGSRSALSAP